MVSQRLKKVQSGQAMVGGYCREVRCKEQHGDIAYERLSDHCPVVLSLSDRDLD